MTNRQAAKLRAGDLVRCKDVAEGDVIHVVERIERIPTSTGMEVNIYASNRVFMAWEVAHCGPRKGWPVLP